MKHSHAPAKKAMNPQALKRLELVNLLRKTRTSDRSARRSRLSLMLWALYHPEAVETGCLIGPQIPSGEQSCQYSPRLPHPIFELPRAA